MGRWDVGQCGAILFRMKKRGVALQANERTVEQFCVRNGKYNFIIIYITIKGNIEGTNRNCSTVRSFGKAVDNQLTAFLIPLIIS